MPPFDPSEELVSVRLRALARRELNGNLRSPSPTINQPRVRRTAALRNENTDKEQPVAGNSGGSVAATTSGDEVVSCVCTVNDPKVIARFDGSR